MDASYEWGLAVKQMGLVEQHFFIDYGQEEIVDYRDSGQLVAALKQKEEEVILAAQLGNALLLENRQLREQGDQLHEKYADKLEELEQSNHELRLKLESCQSQWASQVGDLESDAGDLSARVQQLTRALRRAERDQTRAQVEFGENAQRLQDKLNAAMEVERVMASELQRLKGDLKKTTNQNLPRDEKEEEEVISAMREQVPRLTQREEVLEERLERVCQENADLRADLTSLQTRLAARDRRLSEALQDLEAAQGRSRQLQAQLEELEEQVSLQESKDLGDASLLSELDVADRGVAKAELTEEMGLILELLQPLAQKSPARDEDAHHEDRLKEILQQLKAVAQSVAAQGSGTQNLQLQQENAAMRQKLHSANEQAEVAQQAIRDRDEAIVKKTLMEAELVRSKVEMMSLNNQLLDAIQRKLELSQELEAWQDDIQIVINQQLRSQQQPEPPQKKTSFFRKSGRAAFPRAGDAHQDKAQSRWQGWLRPGKGPSYGK
ncbi:BICD family-like cargo adapter 1 isoform X1 [Syngnathoides biaculeatus]|uniref:BICD family-like cargo adapter 1 isoform X1 n=1 Tax=Syngnathoides biaculeatus TaxID=300417 RepID=UPI002ADE444D|nr:BICD family-like cargo adapter 1 isoform X1 [Syngnathoides biaculeatus]